VKPWPDELDGLSDRIAAYVRAALADAEEPEPFDALAVDIARAQQARCPVAAALAGPPMHEATDIPAVPVALFKDLPVGTVPADEPAPVVFRTSGTTGGGRGTHRLRSSALYDLGAQGFHRRMVPDAPTEVVALLSDPADAPDSSLSHMVADFGRVRWALQPDGLRTDDASRWVREAEGPIYVAATAFSLAEWLASEPPSLPDGSVLMVTGGFKGRTVALSDEQMYARARQVLRPARLVTEYGMTELSSQLWGRPGEAYQAPRWLRPYAVDPATGRKRSHGEVGQLRFVDLCNLDGSVVIETLDEGVVSADGQVVLHGRLQGAEARGCSLTMEDLWLSR
jgi:hypothetical protein